MLTLPRYEACSSILKCDYFPIGCRQDPGEMGYPRLHHKYLARCDNLFRTAYVHAEVVCILPQPLLLFLASSSTLIWLCAQLFLIQDNALVWHPLCHTRRRERRLGATLQATRPPPRARDGAWTMGCDATSDPAPFRGCIRRKTRQNILGTRRASRFSYLWI